MIDQQIEIPTQDGHTTTFITHPERGGIYPRIHHGFAFPKRPVYDRDAAERHWERLLSLHRRTLWS